MDRRRRRPCTNHLRRKAITAGATPLLGGVVQRGLSVGVPRVGVVFAAGDQLLEFVDTELEPEHVQGCASPAVSRPFRPVVQFVGASRETSSAVWFGWYGDRAL